MPKRLCFTTSAGGVEEAILVQIIDETPNITHILTAENSEHNQMQLNNHKMSSYSMKLNRSNGGFKVTNRRKEVIHLFLVYNFVPARMGYRFLDDIVRMLILKMYQFSRDEIFLYKSFSGDVSGTAENPQCIEIAKDSGGTLPAGGSSAFDEIPRSAKMLSRDESQGSVAGGGYEMTPVSSPIEDNSLRDTLCNEINMLRYAFNVLTTCARRSDTEIFNLRTTSTAVPLITTVMTPGGAEIKDTEWRNPSWRREQEPMAGEEDNLPSLGDAEAEEIELMILSDDEITNTARKDPGRKRVTEEEEVELMSLSDDEMRNTEWRKDLTEERQLQTLSGDEMKNTGRRNPTLKRVSEEEIRRPATETCEILARQRREKESSPCVHDENSCHEANSCDASYRLKETVNHMEETRNISYNRRHLGSRRSYSGSSTSSVGKDCTITIRVDHSKLTSSGNSCSTNTGRKQRYTCKEMIQPAKKKLGTNTDPLQLLKVKKVIPASMRKGKTIPTRRKRDVNVCRVSAKDKTNASKLNTETVEVEDKVHKTHETKTCAVKLVKLEQMISNGLR